MSDNQVQPLELLSTAPQVAELTESGGSALAQALRRAAETDDSARSQHHSYNSHSSNPW